MVALSYVTTTPFTGDYPVMTVALRIRPDAPMGSRTLFTLDPPSLWNLNGATVAASVSPGIVTVGGSVAIADVVPGEGWFPAGTVVSVRGGGFSSLSRIRVNDVEITGEHVLSDSEIQLTLAEAATMTAARVRVDNPDGSTSIYYSYLRGIRSATSSRWLLSRTRAVFSGATRTMGTFGPISAMNSSQYAALAFQNPGLTDVDVTLALYGADGTLLQSARRSLESGHRLTLELAELFDGVAPPSDASVSVTSSSPIEMFGLICDEAAWTVTPRLLN